MFMPKDGQKINRGRNALASLKIANVIRARLSYRFNVCASTRDEVFSGSANRELALRICRYIGVRSGKPPSVLSRWRDLLRIEKHSGHDVFIINRPAHRPIST